MLIVTPQIDWRRDGLPSSSALLGGGRGASRGGGRKDGEGLEAGEAAAPGLGRGRRGESFLLLSFLANCVFLGCKLCPLLGEAEGQPLQMFYYRLLP